MDELNVPIFAKAYELYKVLSSFRSSVPKHDRHGLWQRTEAQCLAMIESLFLAGQRSKEVKCIPLEQASVQLNLLRILVRLAKDTKAIDLKKYTQIQAIIDEIERMLGGWIKSVKPSGGMPPPSGIFEVRRNFREAATPMFALQLSSQLLLTFRPLLSKLPTYTRLPSESSFAGSRP